MKKQAVEQKKKDTRGLSRKVSPPRTWSPLLQPAHPHLGKAGPSGTRVIGIGLVCFSNSKLSSIWHLKEALLLCLPHPVSHNTLSILTPPKLLESPHTFQFLSKGSRKLQSPNTWTGKLPHITPWHTPDLCVCAFLSILYKVLYWNMHNLWI